MMIQARSQETLCNVAISIPPQSEWVQSSPVSMHGCNASSAHVQPHTLDLAWAIAKDYLKK